MNVANMRFILRVEVIGDALAVGNFLFHFGVGFWFIHVVIDLGFHCLFKSFVYRITDLGFQ